MTIEQRDTLTGYIRASLIYDITNEPEFWADWIINQAPDGEDWLIEYLDLDSRSDSEQVIAKLGFDPRNSD